MEKRERDRHLGRHAGDGVHVVTGLDEQVVVLLEAEVRQPGVEDLVLLHVTHTHTHAHTKRPRGPSTISLSSSRPIEREKRKERKTWQRCKTPYNPVKLGKTT